MLSVAVGEARYLVEFEAGVGSIDLQRKCSLGEVHLFPTLQDVTVCSIRDASGTHTTDREPVIASGRVARFHRDPPNQLLAEKFALMKALEELDEKYPAAPRDCMPANPKRRRLLFWQAWLAVNRQEFVKQEAVRTAQGAQ